jgi:hypothetical protein
VLCLLACLRFVKGKVKLTSEAGIEQWQDQVRGSLVHSRLVSVGGQIEACTLSVIASLHCDFVCLRSLTYFLTNLPSLHHPVVAEVVVLTESRVIDSYTISISTEQYKLLFQEDVLPGVQASDKTSVPFRRLARAMAKRAFAAFERAYPIQGT